MNQELKTLDRRVTTKIQLSIVIKEKRQPGQGLSAMIGKEYLERSGL